MKKINKETIIHTDISKREALKKYGKYALFTAAASIVFFSPKKAQADSPVDPGWGS